MARTVSTTFQVTLVVLLAVSACGRSHDAPPAQTGQGAGEQPAVGSASMGIDAATITPRDPTRAKRHEMVAFQIEARGVRDKRVLAAMRTVPRHEFVPEELRTLAYHDRPLPIGEDQTISQPYIVAAMTELAMLGPESIVLEVGTGSGYQAAVLAEVAGKVYSIEIVESLAARAAVVLKKLGYNNLELRVGDGYAGWPTAAPFDAIIVTAAPASVPKPLKDQLKVGGRLVIPVGKAHQELLVITRTKDGFRSESVFPVRFVPMTGEAQK